MYSRSRNWVRINKLRKCEFANSWSWTAVFRHSRLFFFHILREITINIATETCCIHRYLDMISHEIKALYIWNQPATYRVPRVLKVGVRKKARRSLSVKCSVAKDHYNRYAVIIRFDFRKHYDLSSYCCIICRKGRGTHIFVFLCCFSFLCLFF